MTNKFSFWSLLSKYGIEIPTIQRDYTYGRSSAKSIRKKMVSSILNAATVNKNLHLDFVYGKLQGEENFNLLDRNRQSIETLLNSLTAYAKNVHIQIESKTTIAKTESADIIVFIPLDGQQRLTTLFLVYWYLAFRLNNKNNSFETLSRFTYSTRTSSKDFFHLLTSHVNSYKLSEGIGIMEFLEMHELFFSTWKKDPTVKSCLTVLGEIEAQLKDKDDKELNIIWDRLIDIDNPIVSFDLFNLDNFEQTDELYVKMNARGKKLTDFENFKAWLIGEFSGKEISVKDWQKKLDIKWNDVFWKNKSSDKSEIDKAYLRFFKLMYLGDYVKKTSAEEGGEKAVMNKNFEDILIGSVDGLPIEIFDQEDQLNSCFESYFCFLDAFEEYELGKVHINSSFIGKDKNLLSLFFSEEYAITWWHATLFYALSRYIIKFENSKTEDFSTWVRVISNLIYNTPIESSKLFRTACEEIDKLLNGIEQKEGVYELLVSGEVDFFDKSQWKEEVKKANICLDDSCKEWEQLFVEAETAPYFYGQIAFILKLCQDSMTIPNFKSHVGCLLSLFDEKILKREDYLLFSYLCTLGGEIEDVFSSKGRNLYYPLRYSSGTLRTRNENWRLYFQGEKLNLIKKLVENILSKSDSLEPESIVAFLENEIKEFDKEGINPVFSAILKSPKVLADSPKNLIREEGKGYYLLNSSRISGYYKELYTYSKALGKADGKDLEYIGNKGRDNLNRTGIKIGEDLIYFDRLDEKFKVEGNEDLSNLDIDVIIKTLQENAK